jgi:ABC-2 type transport system ATP-binding protein
VTGLCSIDSGSVRILGADALRHYAQIGRFVAVTFENHGLYVNLTVWENLEFYARLAGFPASERRVKIDRALELAELTPRSQSLAKTLSKGMLRKLSIARSLLIEPKVLILDEPFDGVDASSRAVMIDMMKTWVQQPEHCILLTSHNMYEVEALCSKVIMLKQGEIIASGSIDSLRETSAQGRVEIRLIEPYSYPTICEALNGRNGIISSTLQGHTLSLVMHDHDVSAVSSMLYEKGIRFTEIVAQHETMNDIYLRLVGKHE